MNKQIITALLGSACLLLGSQAMAATDASGMSIEQAVEKARSLGYTQIEEIELDGDEWEGQGMKEGDEEYEFRFDRKTGEVLKDEED